MGIIAAAGVIGILLAFSFSAFMKTRGGNEKPAGNHALNDRVANAGRHDASASFQPAAPEARSPLFADLDGEKALALIREEPELTILDVRSASEWKTGYISGAKLAPIDQLAAWLAELPPADKPLLIYCHSGGRSAYACEILAQRGFSRLYNLASGIGDWRGEFERDPV